MSDDLQFTQEVTQSDLTLAEAIEAGEIPQPPLMGWKTWMSWRKFVGKRPVTNVDGGTTHNRLESRLWKATMEGLYGEEWMEDLNSGDGGPEPSEFAPAARSSEAAAQRDGSDTRPSAGALEVPQRMEALGAVKPTLGTRNLQEPPER